MIFNIIDLNKFKAYNEVVGYVNKLCGGFGMLIIVMAC